MKREKGRFLMVAAPITATAFVQATDGEMIDLCIACDCTTWARGRGRPRWGSRSRVPRFLRVRATELRVRLPGPAWPPPQPQRLTLRPAHRPTGRAVSGKRPDGH